jgi:phage tail-like protein
MPNDTKNPTPAQPGMRNDPYRSHNFKLDFGASRDANGGGETLFHECSNMSVKVQALKWRSGGNSQIVYRLPGPVEYADIKLKAGITKSKEMWDWMMKAVKGSVERKDCSIILLGENGMDEVMRWNLTGAWISEWSGPALNAMGNGVAIHEMVLVYESLNCD